MNDIIAGYSHLLTGFIGSASFLETVIGVHSTLKRANPNLRYVCDPVLGDKGRLYVPNELVQVYKDKMLSIATVLTPNQFELELLTDIKIVDLASVKAAFYILHGRGIQSIFLTSSEFQMKEETLHLFASVACDQNSGESDSTTLLYEAEIPKLKGHFTGTGYLIAALLLAWTTRCPDDLEKAILNACTSIFGVVSVTKASIDKGENPNKEIRLVQSRKLIESPDVSKSPIVVRKL
jgi:pyridoxine kinase